MSFTAFERETTVTSTGGDDWVHIYSYQRRHITALKKRVANMPEYVVEHVPDVFIHLRVPAHNWNPATGLKRRVSPEQRQASAERLRKIRERA